MDYFKELFDDAGPEGEEELTLTEVSKEAAHDILTNNFLIRKSTQRKFQ